MTLKFLKFIAIFTLVFQLASPASALTGNSGKPAHYVALGDSLAAGMIQDASIGKGYADSLAEMLEEDELLASYNKGFAYPGYKTTNILAELKENIKKPSSTTGEVVALRDEIAKADVITLSIGANDVLSNVKRDEAGNFTFDAMQILAASKTMAKNVDAILKEITAINPSADVFVMGYYNPFPYATEYTAQFNQLVTVLDNEVKKIVEANKMGFVEVVDVLAADTKAYMPNPLNIHPSEAGYAAIAVQFAGIVKEYISLVPLPEVKPDPVPVFTDVNGWAVEHVEKAASYGFVKGYDNGTFQPDKMLTRAQMTAVFSRALQLTTVGEPTPFKDISGYEASTQQEIMAAFEAGIIKGDGALFKPSNQLTRVQAARMFYRAYTHVTSEAYTPKQAAPFTDIAKYGAEDQQAIAMLYELEIATGDKGQFKPASPITRAHVAKMMVNFYEKVAQ